MHDAPETGSASPVRCQSVGLPRGRPSRTPSFQASQGSRISGHGSLEPWTRRELEKLYRRKLESNLDWIFRKKKKSALKEREREGRGEKEAAVLTTEQDALDLMDGRPGGQASSVLTTTIPP